MERHCLYSTGLTRGTYMANLRRLRTLWIFGLFPLGGIALILMGGFWHEAIAWLLFPWTVYVAIRTSRMLCPRCRQPMGRRQCAPLGVRVGWDSPLTPRKCSNCGCPLDV